METLPMAWASGQSTGVEPDPPVAEVPPSGLGREEAIALVLAQVPLLVGYARAIVGGRDLAEDVFQDLVVLVMRKHGDIPNPQAVPGWTRRATSFLALKRLQRSARERPVMDAELIDLLERDAAEPPADTGLDRYAAALAACRRVLPAKSRDLLALRYDADLGCHEIARRLGRPLNTVYVTLTRLHRALEDCIRSRLRRADG
jgi:RNA polymerase sigma-70 factor (ECF subfamily)